MHTNKSILVETKATQLLKNENESDNKIIIENVIMTEKAYVITLACATGLIALAMILVKTEKNLFIGIPKNQTILAKGDFTNNISLTA